MTIRPLKVFIYSSDAEQLALRAAVDSTGAAHVAYSSSSVFSSNPEQRAHRSLRDSEPDVVLIAVPPERTAAVEAIEAVHAAMPEVFLIAVGEAKPQLIVESMRAGAGEFLETPINPEHLREAFSRHLRCVETTKGDIRGKVICFVNAKGGSGATVSAVNTAFSIASKGAPVVLMELAPGGAATLHLNVNPKFTVGNVFANFHCLNRLLLEGFLTDCGKGLQLVAAATERVPPPRPEEFMQLLDLMTSMFRYIVIDASSRLDDLTRITCDFSDRVVLVSPADVVALWSSSKIRQYLTGDRNDKRFGLLLNRYEKIPGFDERQIEAVVGCSVIGQIASDYTSILRSIESGVPVVCDTRSDLGRAFSDLALTLTGNTLTPADNKLNERSLRSLAATRSI